MAASTLYDDLVAELDRQIEREYNPWEPNNQSAASKRMTALRERVMTEDPLGEAYAEGRKDEREAALTADPGPCTHVWDLVHSGATYHDLKCNRCGEHKRETWD